MNALNTGRVGLFLLSFLLVTGTAQALPTSLDPANPVSVYDTGGQLNPGSNGGFFLGGLEAAPGGGAVYVVGATPSALRLIRSTGLGTAVLDGSGPQPWTYASRGNDLTYLNGNYYVAACVIIGKGGGGVGCGGGSGGVFGFIPGVGSTVFASGPPIPLWATSGLTFNQAGTQALVSSDVGIGMWTVTPPSSGVLFANDGAPPAGYGASIDDHVVTLDGRIITIGDGSRLLHDVTGGPGTVFEFFDMGDIPGSGCISGFPKQGSGTSYAGEGAKGPLPPTCSGVGSRGAVDPVSGDIFVAFGSGGTAIFRIAADGSSGSVFATGFSSIRDLDFGPASNGEGFSLYATEVGGIGMGKGNGPPLEQGSIYEFRGFRPPQPVIPTLNIWGLGLLVMVLAGVAGLALTRRRRQMA